MPGTSANVVSDPYIEPRTLYPALACGAGCVWVCFHFAFEWYWIAATALVFLVLAAAISKQATIEYATGKVCERSRLFGRRVIKTQEFPFSEFQAVVYQLRRSDENNTAVGLRLRSGRNIWIRSFSSGDSRRGRGAEEFAWRLSCDTGIEIDEHTG